MSTRNRFLAAAVAFALVSSTRAAILVQARLEVTDLAGTPISSIVEGRDFQLRMTVRDVSNPPPERNGVLQAYFDIMHENAYVSSAVQYLDFFKITDPTFGSDSIRRVGGFHRGLFEPVPLQTDQRVFSVRFQGAEPGLTSFVPSLSQALDTELFYSRP